MRLHVRGVAGDLLLAHHAQVGEHARLEEHLGSARDELPFPQTESSERARRRLLLALALDRGPVRARDEHREAADDLEVRHAVREARGDDAHRLHDARAAQLFRDHIVVPFDGLLVEVRLDAPHEVRLGGVDDLQRAQPSPPDEVVASQGAWGARSARPGARARGLAARGQGARAEAAAAQPKRRAARSSMFEFRSHREKVGELLLEIGDDALELGRFLTGQRLVVGVRREQLSHLWVVAGVASGRLGRRGGRARGGGFCCAASLAPGESTHRRLVGALQQHHQVLGHRVLVLVQDARAGVRDEAREMGDLEGVLLLERPFQPLVGHLLLEDLVQERLVRALRHDALLVEHREDAVGLRLHQLDALRVVDLRHVGHLHFDSLLGILLHRSLEDDGVECRLRAGLPAGGLGASGGNGRNRSPVASGEAASAWWNARASTADAQNANPAVARACSFSLVKLMHSCSSEFTSNISKPKMSRIPMKNLAWFTPSPSLKRFMLIRTTSHWKTRE